MYEHYKKARDMSWKVLLECGINSLPVDLWKIAEHFDLRMHTYSKSSVTQLFREDVLHGDGFIVYLGDRKEIFINDKIKSKRRRRFTVAHELGHGILDHDIGTIHYRNSEIDSQTDMQELEANIFARDILMPATVLAALNIHTPEEIMKLCDVSRRSAEIRAERMEELYRRNMFNHHPAERKVRELFDDFIQNYKNR